MEVGQITHDKESVSASRRNPETLVNFCRKHVSIPDPVGGGTLPQVNQDVEDGAGSHPDQLPLSCGTRLVVEPPQNMSRGAGVVVLNKVGIDTKVPEGVPIPRLKEESPWISEDLGLEEEGVVDFSGEFGHTEKNET